MTKLNLSARRKARALAMQALYQWQFSGDNLKEIETQFHVTQNMAKVDTEYFHELIHQIPANLDKVDEQFKVFLIGRDITELNPVELAIIRIGTYELGHREDVPYKVVINEALELAKSYGSEEGHKYVNGVLDKVAKKLRASEIN